MTDPIDPELLRLVRDGLGDAVPFARHTGVTVDEVADGAAAASLDATPQILNHVGTVHAGALFTLAEAASGAAMAGALAPVLFEITPVVSEASIAYPRPAKGPLRATASIDRAGPEVRAELAENGRIDFRVDVTVIDERDREVATFAATWAVRHSSPAS